MNKNIRQFTLMMFFVVMMFTCKVDANAQADIISDVIWNISGEKAPWGGDYYVKWWNGCSYTYGGAETFSSWNSKHRLTNITYEVEYRYDLIDEMAALVNQERAKVGAAPLTVTDDMTRIAMQRAAETALYWSHTRPNGISYGSLSCLEDSENAHASSYEGEPASEANASLVNSSGHYANMINTKWAYAGYGCVTVNKCTYWVQVFADGKADYYPDGYPDNPYDWKNATYTKKDKYKATVTVPICADYLSLTVRGIGGYYFEEKSMVVGESREREDYELQTMVEGSQKYAATGKATWVSKVSLTSDQYTVESLNDCLSVKNGVITAVKAGTGKIKYTLKANTDITYTAQIKVQEKTVKTGSKVIVSGNTYKVTSTSKKTVSFYKGKTSTTTVSVPKTVKISGKTYKVTAVAANAFKNNKKLTRVTIGANVTKLGSKAFYGCSKLKKITVKTTKLKSVGKNALKGIHKKAVIKVPKSKLTKYKKLFKGKGQKKTVTIKK